MDKQYYCGLDFHKNVSVLCVKEKDGKLIEKVRLKTAQLLTFLSNRKSYHIAIESSGGVFDIVARLKAQKHEVTIMNSSQFRGIGINGKKTDDRDAEALCDALRLGFVPEVHAKTLGARQIRSLLASRDLVVSTRTGLICHARGILREYGLIMPAGITAFWEQVQGKLSELTCVPIRQTLQGIVDQALKLKEQETEIEKALALLCKEDERIQRLDRVPGVGPLTAAALVASIDDASRFPDAKHVGSYLGLTPRENSSGGKRRLGAITKAGPELVRRYLIHGARAAMRYEPTPENRSRTWAARVEARSGTNKAVVALAHKTARICFAMLRDGSEYGIPKPKKSTKPSRKPPTTGSNQNPDPSAHTNQAA